MADFHVRVAAPDDFATLQEFTQRLFLSDQRFEQRLKSNWAFQDAGRAYLNEALGEGHLALLAENPDGAVGFLDGRIFRDDTLAVGRQSEIRQVLVLHEWRRRGVGRALFDRFVEWSEENDAAEVVLGVFEGNEEAFAFYRGLGFNRWIARLRAPIDAVGWRGASG